MDSTENDNEPRLGLYKTQNKANGQRGQQKQEHNDVKRWRKRAICSQSCGSWIGVWGPDLETCTSTVQAIGHAVSGSSPFSPISWSLAKNETWRRSPLWHVRQVLLSVLRIVRPKIPYITIVKPLHRSHVMTLAADCSRDIVSLDASKRPNRRCGITSVMANHVFDPAHR
jgi:hypothetical protein